MTHTDMDSSPRSLVINVITDPVATLVKVLPAMLRKENWRLARGRCIERAPTYPKQATSTTSCPQTSPPVSTLYKAHCWTSLCPVAVLEGDVPMMSRSASRGEHLPRNWPRQSGACGSHWRLDLRVLAPFHWYNVEVSVGTDGRKMKKLSEATKKGQR